MSGSPEREQKALIAFAEGLGWTAEGPNANGYFKLRCPCEGKHMAMVKKTPSNPHYWTQRRRYIARICNQ